MGPGPTVKHRNIFKPATSQLFKSELIRNLILYLITDNIPVFFQSGDCQTEIPILVSFLEFLYRRIEADIKILGRLRSLACGISAWSENEAPMRTKLYSRRDHCLQKTLVSGRPMNNLARTSGHDMQPPEQRTGGGAGASKINLKDPSTCGRSTN